MNSIKTDVHSPGKFRSAHTITFGAIPRSTDPLAVEPRERYTRGWLVLTRVDVGLSVDSSCYHQNETPSPELEDHLLSYNGVATFTVTVTVLLLMPAAQNRLPSAVQGHYLFSLVRVGEVSFRWQVTAPQFVTNPYAAVQ